MPLQNKCIQMNCFYLLIYIGKYLFVQKMPALFHPGVNSLSSVSDCFQYLMSTNSKYVDIAAVALELQNLYRQVCNVPPSCPWVAGGVDAAFHPVFVVTNTPRPRAAAQA